MVIDIDTYLVCHHPVLQQLIHLMSGTFRTINFICFAVPLCSIAESWSVSSLCQFFVPLVIIVLLVITIICTRPILFLFSVYSYINFISPIQKCDLEGRRVYYYNQKSHGPWKLLVEGRVTTGPLPVLVVMDHENCCWKGEFLSSTGSFISGHGL